MEEAVSLDVTPDEAARITRAERDVKGAKSKNLLEVKNLSTHFFTPDGVVRAVDEVSFELGHGETLGLVGESGCGKSTLGRTILQLIPATEGAVILAGKNLSQLSKNDLRHARADFQMIFQDPYASLNPRLTVYDTLAEAIRAHKKISAKDIPNRVAELMKKVGLSPQFIKKYPHEFSGGQRQRIAIARALAVEPKLIVADEPVSALDVSIQAQIINLLGKLSREMELTLIFISHDLSVVKHISDRIAVMYLGKIIELGPAAQVFERPLHPYTISLVSAVPNLSHESKRERILLAGDPPSPMKIPVGCRFHPRCPYAIERCKEMIPLLESLDDPFQQAACIRLKEIHAASFDGK